MLKGKLMRISTKTLFNLISKSDNKDIKESLKNIELIKGDKSLNSKSINTKAIKHTNTKELIETLFKDISRNTKTKESVLETLKQNDIPKQMQTTTKELQNLLNLIKTDKNLVKYSSILEKSILNAKEISSKNIKSEISKSGVFMESKIASTKKEAMPETLKEVLLNLKNLILKNTPKEESLHVKTIDTLLNFKQADTKFAQTLIDLVKSIKNNPVLLKKFDQSLKKLENIIKQNISIKDSNVQEVLATLKKNILKELPKDSLHVKTIDMLLNTKKVDKFFIENLSNLVKNIKNSQLLTKSIESSLSKLENILNQNAYLKNSNVKKILANMKDNLLKEIPNNSLHVKNIEKLLNTPKADKEFLKNIKMLLNNLKNTKQINKPFIEITAKLEILIQKSELFESKLNNNMQVIPSETQKVTSDIKELMTYLKDILVKKNILFPTDKSVNLINIVEKILNMNEIFSKNLSKTNISEQLQQVVDILKNRLIKDDVKNSLHVEVSKLTQKLEIVIKEQIATKSIVPNQKFMFETPIKNELVNDVKATLLSIKHELSTSSLPVHREILGQVERILTQIDYFQLVSFSSNSNTTYLPFSWDSLEGGQISLKKLKENRFFCEINLTLKEYGKIDLMIMLFEDIHVNISVFSEKKEFNLLVQENLLQLKQGINKLGLIPSNVQLFDALKDKKLKEDTRNFVSTTQLGSGLNIEV